MFKNPPVFTQAFKSVTLTQNVFLWTSQVIKFTCVTRNDSYFLSWTHSINSKQKLRFICRRDNTDLTTDVVGLHFKNSRYLHNPCRHVTLVVTLQMISINSGNPRSDVTTWRKLLTHADYRNMRSGIFHVTNRILPCSWQYINSQLLVNSQELSFLKIKYVIAFIVKRNNMEILSDGIAANWRSRRHLVGQVTLSLSTWTTFLCWCYCCIRWRQLNYFLCV